MTDAGGNGRVGYRVAYSPAVREKARGLAEALDADARRHAAEALRVIDARLKTNPLGFGEPRFVQAGVPCQVRVGGAVPWIVRFAVYENLRTVWVLGFHLPGR